MMPSYTDENDCGPVLLKCVRAMVDPDADILAMGHLRTCVAGNSVIFPQGCPQYVCSPMTRLPMNLLQTLFRCLPGPVVSAIAVETVSKPSKADRGLVVGNLLYAVVAGI